MKRVDLGVWATPLEPAPRLAERIGLRPGDLWIKRDDWIAHGGGGNKLRKLEYLIGAVAGAKALITSGAAQSNYCRLTAASARRLGLDVVLVLAGDGPGAATGNLTLDGVFGARIVWAGDEPLDAVVERVKGDAAVLPFGGSNAVGAQGYEDCAAELPADVEHVVVSVGSGATMAGLVRGLGAERVLGVDAGAVSDPEVRVRACGATGELRLRLDQVGPGYELLTAGARRAIDDAGRCEGIVLDPVYTAKAMAGLAAAVADGDIRPGQKTVFIHTGGLPGLFGHPLAAELAAGTA